MLFRSKKVYPDLGDNLGWKISNESLYFLPHICWTDLTTKGLAFRYFQKGFIFDCSANVFFSDNIIKALVCLNSKVIEYFGNILNPTMHFKINNFNSLPYLECKSDIEKINNFTKECIEISKTDWDSFETSWDFQHQ